MGRNIPGCSQIPGVQTLLSYHPVLTSALGTCQRHTFLSTNPQGVQLHRACGWPAVQGYISSRLILWAGVGITRLHSVENFWASEVFVIDYFK